MYETMDTPEYSRYINSRQSRATIELDTRNVTPRKHTETGMTTIKNDIDEISLERVELSFSDSE